MIHWFPLEVTDTEAARAASKRNFLALPPTHPPEFSQSSPRRTANSGGSGVPAACALRMRGEAQIIEPLLRYDEESIFQFPAND